MNIDTNAYLAKQYPQPPCWFLVADVYATEFGQPVELYQAASTSIRAIASAMRIATHTTPKAFRQIDAPKEGCIVLLGKTRALGAHHCGIYTSGKVLHMLTSGGYFEELSVIGDQYALIEFWEKA